MKYYTAQKSNVVLIETAKQKRDAKAQGVALPVELSEPAKDAPVHTRGITQHTQLNSSDSLNRDHSLMSDLSAFANDQLTLKELKTRWESEYNSFHAMRYQRTGPKGDYTRHPAFDDFPGFLSLVGAKPASSYTLDRIDPSNPEYGPGLVQWASKAAQTHNRSNTKMLTCSQGHRYSIAEWSRKTGISQSTIRSRLASGKSVDDTVYTSVGGFSRESTSAPTNTGHYIRLWKTLLDQHHGQTFFEPSGKEVKQLQLVVDALAKGKVGPDEALELIQSDWRAFTDFAESYYGAWQRPPMVPTVAYLAANIQAAGNFYQKSTEKTELGFEDAKGLWDE